jgi:hypothetical protein
VHATTGTTARVCFCAGPTEAFWPISARGHGGRWRPPSPRAFPRAVRAIAAILYSALLLRQRSGRRRGHPTRRAPITSRGACLPGKRQGYPSRMRSPGHAAQVRSLRAPRLDGQQVPGCTQGQRRGYGHRFPRCARRATQPDVVEESRIRWPKRSLERCPDTIDQKICHLFSPDASYDILDSGRCNCSVLKEQRISRRLHGPAGAYR